MKKTPKITMDNRQKGKDLKELFRDFIKYCRVKNLSEHTLTYYEKAFYTFTNFFKGDAEDITEETVQDYILHLRKDIENSVSVNTYVRGLRVILYYFMKIGYITKFKISIPKAEKKLKETYTDTELQILLKKPDLKKCNFAEYRTWVIINFLVGTGARANTLCNIKIEDLNLEDGYVMYRKTKNKKQQIVPMTNQLCLILTEYLAYRVGEKDDYLFVSVYDEKLNTNSLRHSIVKYNHARGVTKTSVHLFRHTFAKKWIINGGNIFSLQKILGHSSLDIVKEYVNLFGDDIRRDYDKFNPLNQFTNTKHIKMHR